MPRKLHPDPDLQSLIRKLNAAADGAPETAGGESGPPDSTDPGGTAATRARWALPTCSDSDEDALRWLLAEAHQRGASDLLLVVGRPATVRVDGRLHALDGEVLVGSRVGRLCASLAPSERRSELRQQGSLDFTASRAGIGRFRCNVHRERGHWAAAIRLLPLAPPGLDELGLPQQLDGFSKLNHGLLLVTGPTGSGKSTTMAALTRRILESRSVHLITIEDPVEYEHEHHQSVVEHIEIGRDVPSFAAALRSALRQDPDVLLIGEMRDTESISIAITAAETGHLVISTLHTSDAPQTVNRILDSYPAKQVDAVRSQLAVSLAGIVSQQLMPRIDGAGRVPAVEILRATPGVRNLIRQGKIEQLRSQLTLERSKGMLSLDQSLVRLVRDGAIDAATARTRARVPSELEALLNRQ